MTEEFVKVDRKKSNINKFHIYKVKVVKDMFKILIITDLGKKRKEKSKKKVHKTYMNTKKSTLE